MHIWRSEEEIGYPGLVACLSSLEECLFKFLVFFFFKLNRLSLLLNFKSSLYILDNRHSCFKSSHLFNYSFIFFGVFACVYMYIYVCTTCVPGTAEVTRGHWTPWNSSYRWL